MTKEIEQDIDALEILIDSVYIAIRQSLTHEHINLYWNVGRHTLTSYQHLEVYAKRHPRSERWLVEISVDFYPYAFAFHTHNEDIEKALEQLKTETDKWLTVIKGEKEDGRPTAPLHSVELVAPSEEMG